LGISWAEIKKALFISNKTAILKTIKKSPEIWLLHRKIACFRGKFLNAGGGT